MRRWIPMALAALLAIGGACAESEPDRAAAAYEKAQEAYSREHDYALAAQYMTEAAELGLADAQAELGFYYYTGQGVEPSIAEAMKWWEIAAENGDTDAMRYLAYCYANAEEADMAKSTEYLEKAAQLGDTKAQYTLGTMYIEGNGVVPDEATAIDYFTRASGFGDVDAQTMMGLRYYEAGDYNRAQVYLQAAASQNVPEAQYAMGYICFAGKNGTRDEEQAEKWWTKAAENGNRDAICALYYLRNRNDGFAEIDPGYRGEKVEEMRQILTDLGYMDNSAGDYYDEAMEHAVELFQEAHDLPVTGGADEVTQAYIYFYKDSGLGAVKIESLSIREDAEADRLYVSFANEGDKVIREIDFKVVPLDADQKPMSVYNIYDAIDCIDTRVLEPDVAEGEAYYWYMENCTGVYGVKIAISGIIFTDGSEVRISDACLNPIIYLPQA